MKGRSRAEDRLADEGGRLTGQGSPGPEGPGRSLGARGLGARGPGRRGHRRRPAPRHVRVRAWLAFAAGSVVLAVAAAGLMSAIPATGGGGTPPGTAPSLPPTPAAVLSAAGSTDAPVPDPARLAAELDPLLDGAGTVSGSVVDAATGEVLYERRATTPAVPASTTKLVTATTVLAARGPAHRIPTVAVAGRRPGEVVLVGGGDPTLAVDGAGAYPGAARLDDLAGQVRAAMDGIPVARVTVDAERFRGDVYGPWDADIPHGGYVGPITALMTDGGRVDPADGTPAVRHDDPALAAGRAFAELLDADPDSVTGGTGPDPGTGAGVPAGLPEPGTVLGRVTSPPMLRLVEFMLTDSDNVVAEALARQVALARGEPASYEGAARAMAAVLDELGSPLDRGALADGSGLSRDNRLSASLLTRLLRVPLSRADLGGVHSGLPVGGWSGTLAQRYRSPQPDTGAGAGTVRAKTGTLAGVNALAGLVETADGRLLAFALLANDAPPGTPDLLDAAAAAIAGCGCR